LSQRGVEDGWPLDEIASDVERCVEVPRHELMAGDAPEVAGLRPSRGSAATPLRA
jgi:hypothetical protein